MVSNTLLGDTNFSTTINQQLLNSSDIDSACYINDYTNDELQNYNKI